MRYDVIIKKRKECVQCSKTGEIVQLVNYCNKCNHFGGQFGMRISCRYSPEREFRLTHKIIY